MFHLFGIKKISPVEDQLRRHERLDAVEVRLEQPMRLQTASRLLGVSDDELAQFNPALMPAVRSGSSSMPEGYVLRVPGAASDMVAQLRRAPVEAQVQVAAAPEEARRPAEPSSEPVRVAAVESPKVREATVQAPNVKSVRTKEAREEARVVAHRVTPGQTLFSIARRYGTTVALIQGLNNVRGGVQAGQILRVPSNPL